MGTRGRSVGPLRWRVLAWVVVAVALVAACSSAATGPTPTDFQIGPVPTVRNSVGQLPTFIPPESTEPPPSLAPDETPNETPGETVGETPEETLPPETAPADTTPPVPTGSRPPGGLVRFTNLSDQAVDVRTFTFNESGHASEQFGVPLEAHGLASASAIPGGTYRLIFEDHTTSNQLGTCDFSLGADATLDFVVVDETDIAVADSDTPANVLDDLLLATAPVCHATP